MSTGRFQPVTQVPMTNVAVVRYKKYGKRFEVAAYRNKVVNWRNGVEKDIDEVLQSDMVFESVSKGISAKSKDLEKVFGTHEHSKCARIILDKGDLQISDREREAHLDSLFRDIATIVASKCVDPSSNRPYPVSVIERAMKDVHFSAKLNKNAKQQALEVIQKLKGVMPIQRSQMRVRFSFPVNIKDEIDEMLRKEDAEVEYESDKQKYIFYNLKIDPGTYRHLQKCVDKYGNENCALEVIEFSLQNENVTSSATDSSAAAGLSEATSGGKPTEHVVYPAESEAAKAQEIKGEGATSEHSRAEYMGRSSTNKVVQPQSGGKCNTCGATFADKNEQRDHYRSKWHRFNLKRKVKGISSISLEDFDEFSEDELNKEMENLNV